MFLGGIERDQWHEMGKFENYDFLSWNFASTTNPKLLQKIQLFSQLF